MRRILIILLLLLVSLIFPSVQQSEKAREIDEQTRLRKSLDGEVNEKFSTALRTLIKSIYQSREQREFLIKKFISWDRQVPEKVMKVLELCEFRCSYWDLVWEEPELLRLLKYFFETSDIEITRDIIIKPEEAQSSGSNRLRSKLYAFFGGLIEQLLDPDEKGLYYDYEELGEGLVKDYQHYYSRSQRIKEIIPFRPAAINPYDVRSAPVFFQELVHEMVLPVRIFRYLLSKTSKEHYFPIDIDPVGIPLLEEYIKKTNHARWTEAATIAAYYFSEQKLKSLIQQLRKKGSREKVDYLESLQGNKNQTFFNTYRDVIGTALRLPEHSPIQCLVTDLELAPMLRHELEYKIENHFYKRMTGIVTGIQEKKYLQYMKESVRNNKAELLTRLVIIAMLKDEPQVDGSFFRNLVEQKYNEWIRAAGLWVLIDRGERISDSLMISSLKNHKRENPFFIFLILTQINKDHRDKFEPLVETLLLNGSKILQKKILEKIHGLWGYKRLASYVLKMGINHLNPIPKRYVLQKAYEHKDWLLIRREFLTNNRKEFCIPSGYALLEHNPSLVISKTMEKLIQHIQNREKKYDVDSTAREYINILLKSGAREVVDFFIDQLKQKNIIYEFNRGLVGLMPIMNDSEILQLEKVMRPGSLCQGMLDNYDPRYLPSIKSYLNTPGLKLDHWTEHIFRSDCQELFPIARKHFQENVQKKTPYPLNKRIANGFILEEYGSRRSFAKDIFETKENIDVIKELLWIIENGDDTSVYCSLQLLLNFDSQNPEIDAVMTRYLDQSKAWLRLPALFWYAREKKTFIIPYIKKNLQINPINRLIAIEALYSFNNSEALNLLIQMIREKHLDIWHKIDIGLRKIADLSPCLLVPFIDDPDVNVKKKVLCALKGKLKPEQVTRIKPYLSQPDSSLAVAAFEALSGLWKPEDLSLLTSLYGKIRSMHIKIDILEAISSLGNQDNNSIDFLKEQVQLNTILSPYAELYLHANNPEKLAKYITRTQNINLFFRGLECLRQSDSQAYLDMVMKSAIPAKKRVDSFLSIHEVTSEDEEEHSVPETPGSSTHTKSPRISRTVYTFKGEQSDNNRIHNIRRLFTLQGNRYAYLHMEHLDGEPYSHCTIQFTSNFKDWSNPLPYTIKSSLSGQFILALDKHRILLSIMQEKPDANIFNQRPFFRIIDENEKIQPGFYPLKEEITFSEQDLFRFGGKYYLVGFPGPGMESLGWDLELNKNVFIYSSTDLKVWEKAKNIILPDKCSNINNRFITLPNQVEKVFLLSADKVYSSTDLKEWHLVFSAPEHICSDLFSFQDGYCLVTKSDRSGFYEAYLHFSPDLKNWTSPLHTGTEYPLYPSAGNWGTDGQNLFYINQNRIEQFLPDEAAVDSDQDGISDVSEESLLTDPNNPDSDGDGIRDGKDTNPLCKPLSKPTESMKIRQAVLAHYFTHKLNFIIVVTEGTETQCFDDIAEKVLCFTQKGFSRYTTRVKSKGDFMRIYFNRIKKSSDGTRASVSFTLYHGPLAAQGYLVNLRKIKGKWKVISLKTLWMS